MCRDYQRSKVYAWEHKAVPTGRLVAYADIPDYVARVWAAEGLSYPPLVKPMPKQVTRWAGLGCRDSVWFPERGATERVILHELAHSLTSTLDGDTDRHGAAFVTRYMQLAAKHLPGCSIFVLWFSAEKAGINFTKQV